MILVFIMAFSLSTQQAAVASEFSDYEVGAGEAASSDLEVSGLKGFYTPYPWKINIEPILPASNFGIDCLGSSPAGQDVKVSNLALNIIDLAGHAACAELKTEDEDRYSEVNCKLTVECSKLKMGKSKTILSYVTLPIFIGEDYAGIHLDQKIADMEKMEALRKFAEKKYGKKISAQCSPRFDYIHSPSTELCDSSVMDKGFARFQEDCSILSSGCYNHAGHGRKKEYKTFMSTFKEEDAKKSSVQAYFNDLTDTAVSESLSFDSEMLEGLSSIIGSKDSKDTKLKNIFAKFEEFEKLGKLDPLFSFNSDNIYYSNAAFKSSIHYKFFEKLSATRTNSAEAKAAIEKYRLDSTTAILKKDCKETPRFSDICNDATRVAKSGHPGIINRKQAARRIPQDKEGDDRFEMLKALYPEVKSLEDYRVVMEASRCSAFNFTGDRRPTLPFSLLSDSRLSLGSAWDSYNTPAYNSVRSTPNDKPSILSPIRNVIEKAPAPTAGSASVPEKNDSINTKPSENGTLSESFAEGMKKSAIGATINGTNNSSNLFNANSFNKFTSSLVNDKKNEASQVNDESDNEKSAENRGPYGKYSDAGLNSKVSELSRKLASAEENLERLKAEKEEKEADAAKQKKIDDQGKSIADLKAQINTLKTETIKTSAASPVNKSNDQSNDLFAQSSSKAIRTESQAAAIESAASVATQRNLAATHQASVGTSSGPSSQGTQAAAIRPASFSSGNAIPGDSRGRLVLTKIDGLSSEKASEAINQKIIELKGERFLIEEGGMLKEIIPKIENNIVVTDKFGMPVYETIIVGEAALEGTRLARVSKKGNKNTDPPINSPADLQRDQEEKLKRAPAQYRKLKKLTNEVWNKK